MLHMETAALLIRFSSVRVKLITAVPYSCDTVSKVDSRKPFTHPDNYGSVLQPLESAVLQDPQAPCLHVLDELPPLSKKGQQLQRRFISAASGEFRQAEPLRMCLSVRQ